MQYNLIRNGSLQSLTSPGTGDISLSYAELEKLQNQNFTSSGVEITNSGTLYLEVDLSQRIKIDGIRLYADDLSKSSNISFGYKNEESDSYTSLNTISGSYYSASTITDPSAPQFVRAVISGTNIELYEFQVFNDDYIVAFGEDGQLYAEYIDDTPIGEAGTAQSIDIYNNGTSNIPAVAYTCIDITDNDGDNYVEISTNIDSGYVSLDDGVLIEDDNIGSDFRWSDGWFDNTEVNVDLVELSSDSVVAQLSQIPSNSKSNGWYVTEAAWDFDIVSKRMFCSGSDGIYKLWEYDYNNDTYTYMGEIGGGVVTSEEWDGSIAVLGDRIYSLPHSTQFFGSYEIDGPQDNWTTLPSHPLAFSTGYPQRRILCSDYNRYIYCIDIAIWNLTKAFYRYDTTTSGWSSLNNGYNWSNSTSFTNSMSCYLTYDTDRDYIYLSYQFRGDPWYIQRYNVATNSWNTTYYNLSNLKSPTNFGSKALISYNNDNIWIAFDANLASNDIYRYDLTTSITTRYTNIGWESQYWGTGTGQGDKAGGYLIAIDPLVNDETPSHIFAGLTETSATYIYQFPGTHDYGDYTTPIFRLDDKYRSSYFITDGNTDPDTGSISYDAAVYNGTIRVRSSDTVPLTVDEVYYAYSDDSVGRWRPYINSLTQPWKDLSFSSNWDALATAVNRRNGNIVFSLRLNSPGTSDWRSYIYVYNRSGSLLHSLITYSTWKYAFNVFMDFDKNGGIWGYADYGGSQNDRHLIHFDNSLSVDADISDGSDFVYMGAAELDGDGLWYTHEQDNILYHLRWDGAIQHTIPLPEPKWVCGTLDNGCWVHDWSLDQLLRYDSDGALVTTVDIAGTMDDDIISAMCHDFNNGVWFRIGHNIFHMTSGGAIDIGPVYVLNAQRLQPSHNGVYAIRTSSPDTLFFINNSGVIEKSQSISSSSRKIFGALSYNYDDFLDFKTQILPISYDPVWGTGGSAEWLEVRKDGYFLPKKSYHQSEVTLRGEAELTKIIMAPSIKTEDIPPEQYKTIYIRSNIPETAGIGDYSTRLKTWWGLEE